MPFATCHLHSVVFQASTRLTESPAVIAAGFEQAAVYRHMKQVAVMQGKKGYAPNSCPVNPGFMGHKSYRSPH